MIWSSKWIQSWIYHHNQDIEDFFTSEGSFIVIPLPTILPLVSISVHLASSRISHKWKPTVCNLCILHPLLNSMILKFWKLLSVSFLLLCIPLHGYSIPELPLSRHLSCFHMGALMNSRCKHYIRSLKCKRRFSFLG